jgi:ATP-dependent exoDNAse (exonuclease V) alpha subunit
MGGMGRKELSARLEEEMRLSRAVHERHAMAFERLMSAFDRFEQAFDRHEQAFDRHEQAFERVMTALDRHEAQTGDLTVFVRDINRRSEKVINDLLRGNREFCRELTAKTGSTTEKILARLDNAREESKAHREALLALIDRLPPTQAA